MSLIARCPVCHDLTLEIRADYFAGDRWEPPSFDAEITGSMCGCTLTDEQTEDVLNRICDGTMNEPDLIERECELDLFGINFLHPDSD